MRYVISRRGPADRRPADNGIQSTREDDIVSNPDWRWPNGKRIAVVFNVCLEAWSDGKAPGISPMGNPLPAGVLDTMAISWAAYGVKTGIYRLLDAFERQGAKTSVMVNAVVAERAPEAVKAVADGGHEVLSHSYAMDVIPALLSDEDERKNIERCTRLLETASGQPIRGWLSPRGTSRKETPRLLADAGYRWYGDVFDTDLPYVQRFGDKKIVAIPLSYDVNDMPSMKYGSAPKAMLDAFEEVVAIARERDDELRIIDVTSHAHIFGHHRGAYYYEKIIEKAVSANDIWIGTRAQIADHVLSQKG
jgi:peptidoglycan/xylan/chitin deacetylase (PgdA/CDA1 family)